MANISREDERARDKWIKENKGTGKTFSNNKKSKAYNILHNTNFFDDGALNTYLNNG